MSIRIGIQMYTLRSQLKSPESVEEAFRRSREMGAQCVQAYPVSSVSAAFLSELSKRYELPICTMHAPVNRMQNDLARLAEEFQAFGCNAIGIGMMPMSFRKQGMDGTKAFAQFLNEAGSQLQSYGMHITYHNHSFEFKSINGKTHYDYLLEHTEPFVHFTPDVYWIKAGGNEPEDIINRLSERTRVLHLKDWKKGIAPFNMKGIGAGILDFASILQCAEKAGVQDAVIELDYARKPWQSLENSLRFLERVAI